MSRLARTLAGSRPRLVAAAVVLVVAVGSVAAAWQLRDGDEATPADAAGPAEPIAATVNGTPIPESRVELEMSFDLHFGVPGEPDESQDSDRQTVVGMLVEAELLYSEAQLRGLAPHPARVVSFLAYEAIAVQMAAQDGEPGQAERLAAWTARGHPAHAWPADPVMREGMSRAWAIGSLADSVGDDTSLRDLLLELVQDADIVIGPGTVAESCQASAECQAPLPTTAE